MKKLIVEPRRIRLDDRILASIDQSTRAVSVTRKDGQLSIVADGRLIYQGKLR